jgi:hypothetical protein
MSAASAAETMSGALGASASRSYSASVSTWMPVGSSGTTRRLRRAALVAAVMGSSPGSCRVTVKPRPGTAAIGRQSVPDPCSPHRTWPFNLSNSRKTMWGYAATGQAARGSDSRSGDAKIAYALLSGGFAGGIDLNGRDMTATELRTVVAAPEVGQLVRVHDHWTSHAERAARRGDAMWSDAPSSVTSTALPPPRRCPSPRHGAADAPQPSNARHTCPDPRARVSPPSTRIRPKPAPPAEAKSAQILGHRRMYQFSRRRHPRGGYSAGQAALPSRSTPP